MTREEDIATLEDLYVQRLGLPTVTPEWKELTAVITQVRKELGLYFNDDTDRAIFTRARGRVFYDD